MWCVQCGAMVSSSGIHLRCNKELSVCLSEEEELCVRYCGKAPRRVLRAMTSALFLDGGAADVGFSTAAGRLSAARPGYQLDRMNDPPVLLVAVDEISKLHPRCLHKRRAHFLICN